MHFLHRIKILLPVIVCLKFVTFAQGNKLSEYSVIFNYLSIIRIVSDNYIHRATWCCGLITLQFGLLIKDQFAMLCLFMFKAFNKFLFDNRGWSSDKQKCIRSMQKILHLLCIGFVWSCLGDIRVLFTIMWFTLKWHSVSKRVRKL